MIKRRKLSKAERAEVYGRCNGHCAYCGEEIQISQMQADHVKSLYGELGEDTLENMLPSCRSCNHYKSTLSLEDFRKSISRIPGVFARNNSSYKIAVRYGIVIPNANPVVFYFERLKHNQQKEPRKTNADRIRSMSDEELAKFLAIVSTPIYRAEEKDSEINKNLKWLRAESKED